eukprot:PhF_6_TR25500/c0_g2_i4/m.35531
MWDKAIERDANTPIGSLVLRQYRRKLKPCFKIPLQDYPSIIDTQMPQQCYSSGDWDDSPIPMKLTDYVRNYTNETEFRAVKHDDPTLVTMKGVPVTGFYQSYGPVDEQYIVRLPYEIPDDPRVDLDLYFEAAHRRAKGKLQFLEESEWLRPGVATVIAETFIANFMTRTFVHLSLVFEVHISGHLKALMHTYPIQVRSLSVPFDCFLFALDVILVLYPILMFAEAMSMLRLNHRLFRRKRYTATYFLETCTLGVLFNLASAVCLSLLLGYRFMRWRSWQTLYTNNGKEMYQNLSYLTELDGTINNMTAWVSILCIMRAFAYLRYNIRMSIINETVVTALPDMFGIVLLYYFLIGSYTVGGILLFGNFSVQFSSIGSASMYLLEILFAANIDISEFLFKRPYASVGFFVSYLIFSWMILLNIVVGILTAAFSSVRSTQALLERRWGITAVFKDAVRMYHKTFSGMYKVGMFSRYVTKCFALLDKLETYRQEDTVGGTPESFIKLSSLMVLARDHFGPAHVRHMFRMATAQRGASNAKQRAFLHYVCNVQNQVNAATAVEGVSSMMYDIFNSLILNSESPLRNHDPMVLEYQRIEKELSRMGEQGGIEIMSGDEMKHLVDTVNDLSKQLEEMCVAQERMDRIMNNCVRLLNIDSPLFSPSNGFNH